MRQSILVVDDQEQPRRALTAELIDAGFDVYEAEDGAQAWESFRRIQPDLVITDMVMPHSDGLELLSRVRAHSEVPVIMFTAHGSVESAVSALKAGADEFVASCDVDPDGLVGMIQATLERRVAREPGELEQRLIGSSAAMCRLRNRVAALAPLSTPVLVSGEPGSGRDTVVHALHELGATGGQKLVRIDAQGFRERDPIPEKGAVYLDGVENLARPLQSVWARYLERPPAPGGARVFASASDRLAARMAAGDFDPRLGSALLRFHVQIPSLCERTEDIPAVADALTRRAAVELGRPRLQLSGPARQLLARQPWPGNLAQLSQVLERAVAFSCGREVRRSVVEDILSELEESVENIRHRHRAGEREALVAALRETGGNVSRTAEILGRSRPGIYRLMSKFGIPLERRPGSEWND